MSFSLSEYIEELLLSVDADDISFEIPEFVRKQAFFNEASVEAVFVNGFEVPEFVRNQAK